MIIYAPNDKIIQFKKAHPNLDLHFIGEVEKAFSLTETAYGADITVQSAIFYQRLDAYITGYSDSFDGKCGGISGFPGSYSAAGNVYPDDLDKLFSETASVMFVFAVVYSSLIWFDSSHNLLGPFQGGGFSLLSGSGGGTGSWSD